MENAAEALKMAFYVIVFVLALALSINMFTKAKATSDIVLTAADESRYYEYDQITVSNIGSSVDSAGNRIVGLETIIPTLYKYDKERYRVEFKKASADILNNSDYLSDLDILDNLTIYTSTSKTAQNKDIYYFDISEEENRAEPWVGSSDQIKLHLDAILNGEKYKLPQYLDASRVIDYKNNSLSIAKSKNKRFVEIIGRSTTVGTNELIGNKTTTKTIITYILLN